MDDFSITAEHSVLPDEKPGITVKISCSAYEINVGLEISEIDRLGAVPKTPWEEGAVRAGTSAGANVFWSCDDDEVSIHVGHDDETWDFGVSIPLDEFDQMLDEIERELTAPVP